LDSGSIKRSFRRSGIEFREGLPNRRILQNQMRMERASGKRLVMATPADEPKSESPKPTAKARSAQS
jgi:hypothetical protein